MIQKKQVKIEATMRVISLLKGKPLTAAEQFIHTIPIMAGIDYPDHVLQALCDSEVRIAYVEVFRERLKTTPALKNSIGGTKWSADLMHLEFERL